MQRGAGQQCIIQDRISRSFPPSLLEVKIILINNVKRNSLIITARNV